MAREKLFIECPERVRRFHERYLGEDVFGPDSCWDWFWGVSRHDYGVVGWWVDGKSYAAFAHRVAYQLAHPDENIDGLVIRHKCDRPCCVNPNCLLIGTPADNSRDMVERGRAGSSPGEKNGRVKLTADQVLEIRRLYAGGGWLQRELGEKFGVARSIIGRIIRRKLWAHI